MTRYTTFLNYDPAMYEVLLSCDRQPMLLAQNSGNRKVLVLPFSVHYSNFAMRFKDISALFYNLFEQWIPCHGGRQRLLRVRGRHAQRARAAAHRVQHLYGRIRSGFKRFPATLRLNVPGTYSLVQITDFGEQIEQRIYAKIPSAESNIFAQADSFRNPFLVESLGNEYKSLIFYIAIALCALSLCRVDPAFARVSVTGKKEKKSMSNFPIQFTTPWLLLLIIPLVGVGLLLYFLSNKKYRRTRNRIISLVLHCLVSVLCVFVLSGVYIRYDISNEANEVLFVVDVSDSGVNSEQTRDDFMKAALETGAWYEGYKVGVVTFGFDQKYAVPLTDDVDSVYDEYMAARLPSETGGTDIASALTYASKLFTENASAKIVLVTDGKETDNAAEEVIQSVTARGILVDTAYIPSSFGLEEGGDVQVLGVEYPSTTSTPTISSRWASRCTATPTRAFPCPSADNGEVRTTVQYGMETGTHTVEIPFSFYERRLPQGGRSDRVSGRSHRTEQYLLFLLLSGKV